MQQSDAYQPVIVWRSGLYGLPERAPVETDVQDGRAEYLLDGPYHLAEGASIMIKAGKVLYFSGMHKPF
ncbi:hypothetical protein [Pseudomonas prosekii]|uniref:hypothetical protein n=1 Tax=Pseudomonas prosekii TaxID=1148509 RepID=UPI003F74C204